MFDLDFNSVFTHMLQNDVEHYLSEISRAASQDAALFAEMPSLTNDGRYPALELSAEQRHQRTLEALLHSFYKWWLLHAKIRYR